MLLQTQPVSWYALYSVYILLFLLTKFGRFRVDNNVPVFPFSSLIRMSAVAPVYVPENQFHASYSFHYP